MFRRVVRLPCENGHFSGEAYWEMPRRPGIDILDVTDKGRMRRCGLLATVTVATCFCWLRYRHATYPSSSYGVAFPTLLLPVNCGRLLLLFRRTYSPKSVGLV